MALPTSLSGLAFRLPTNGIGYSGPFISSAGNVYVVGTNTSNQRTAILKATDPTTSFSASGTTSTFGDSAIDVHQVGDVLHVLHMGGNGAACTYYTWNMATDTATTGVQVIAAASFTTVINGGCTVVKRSTGGDVIAFYNTNGVVNMGKTYGRVAARRIAGGTTAGAETAIGIGILATTQQYESVEAAVLGTSDRVHLFWTQGPATPPNYTALRQRTVKSTDNLDVTSPATAAETSLAGHFWQTAAVDFPARTIGQPTISAGGTVFVAGTSFAASVNKLGTYTKASADAMGTLTADATVSTDAVLQSAAGTTTGGAMRIGGAHFDVDDRYVTWIDNATSDPMYDVKPSGGAWGTDQTIEATTATQISSNVFQRGSNIVLAVVYDRAGTWHYNEVVLHAAGGDQVVPVATVACTASVPAVTISIPQTVAPARVAATASVPSVSIQIGQVAAVSPVSAVATVRSVTISTSSTVTVSPVSATAQVRAVTISTPTTVAVSQVAATATVRSVSISIGQVVAVSTVAAVATIQPVTIGTSSSATATPAAVAATSAVPSVTISTSAGQDVPAATVAAVAQVKTITISASATVAPSTYRFTQTVSDTFDRADNASSMGSTDGGLTLVWQPLVGTWGISGNRAYLASTSVFDNFAVVDTGSADGFVQGTIGTYVSGMGLVFRVVDGANFWLAYVTGSIVELYRYVGGAYSLIGTGSKGTIFAPGDVVRAEFVGPNIVLKVNGVPMYAGSSAVHQTQTKHGVYAYGVTVGQWTNWSSGAVAETLATVSAFASVPPIAIGLSSTVAPAQVSAVASVPAVVVQTGAGLTITVGTVAAVAAVPSVTLGIGTNIAVGVVAATAQVRSVAMQITGAAAVSSVVAVGSVPTVTPLVAAAPAPPKVSAVATVPAVTILPASRVVATPVQAAATVRPVTLAYSGAAPVSPVTAVAIVQEVGVNAGGTTIPVVRVQAVATVRSVSISIPQIVPVSTVAATSIVRPVTIAAPAFAGPVFVQAFAQVPAVTIQTGGNTLVPVSTVAAFATVRVPTLIAAAVATPPVVAALGSVPAVAPKASAAVTVAVVAAVAVVRSPSIGVEARAVVSTVVALATVLTPSIRHTAVVIVQTVQAFGAVPFIKAEVVQAAAIPIDVHVPPFRFVASVLPEVFEVHVPVETMAVLVG